MKLFARRNFVAATITLIALSMPTLARGEDRRAAVGVVSHLNLVSDKSQDVSSLEAWKRTYLKPEMSDQEKAIAVFDTMVRYRQQASPPHEYLRSGMAGGHVHDPMKTIHVYGYGQCCCVAGENAGLARYLGMPARGRDITAHSVCEVYYDDAWHLIDSSVMNYFLKEDGKLASVDEIHQAVRAWFKENPQHQELAGVDSKLRKFAKDGGWKQGPPLLAKAETFYGRDGVNDAGWHGWPSTMQEYYKVREPAEYTVTMGHQLNVQLRPGERITRNFFSRGIEYTNDCNNETYKSLTAPGRKSLGMQAKLGDRAPGRIGDGTIEWNVPMAQLDAVALSNSAEGFVLRFPSSYVYVKGQATLKTTVADGGSVTVSFSDNNGLDWKEVARIEKSGDQTIDLSDLVKRRYDYRLKFAPQGSGTRVDGIHAVHDFQCSQAALPVIAEGENTMTFAAGPQEGTITIDGSTELEQAKKHKQLAITDFHPELNGVSENLRLGGGSGDATFAVATPGDMTRLRISTVWRARDAKDGWQALVSFDDGKTFNPVPNGNLQGGTKGESRYLIVDSIPAGARQAKIKFAGTQRNTTCLFDLRIDADYKEPAGAFRPVKITYAWDESGQAKTHTHVAKSERETFGITAGAGAVAKSFAMELE
jgi:hypothetical protein